MAEWKRFARHGMIVRMSIVIEYVGRKRAPGTSISTRYVTGAADPSARGLVARSSLLQISLSAFSSIPSTTSWLPASQ